MVCERSRRERYVPIGPSGGEFCFCCQYSSQEQEGTVRKHRDLDRNRRWSSTLRGSRCLEAYRQERNQNKRSWMLKYYSWPIHARQKSFVPSGTSLAEMTLAEKYFMVNMHAVIKSAFGWRAS